MKIFLLILALSLSAFGQTTAAAPTDDQMDAELAAFNAGNLTFSSMGLAWLNGRLTGFKLRLDTQDIHLNNLDLFSQSAQAAIDQMGGEMKTQTGLINSLNDGVSRAENDAANALSAAQMFADAFPCAILNFKVTTDLLGNRIVVFTTPTATCTGWMDWSGATKLQASRLSFSGSGTLGPYNTLPASSFTFAIPLSVPAHGTMQAMTWDSGGTRTVRQIEF